MLWLTLGCAGQDTPPPVESRPPCRLDQPELAESLRSLLVDVLRMCFVREVGRRPPAAALLQTLLARSPVPPPRDALDLYAVGTLQASASE